MTKVGVFGLVLGVQIVASVVVWGATVNAASPLSVNVNIDPESDRALISPLIYGSNGDVPGAPLMVRRQGGNRMTGYNWENNASNAGNDWQHSSDGFMTRDLPSAVQDTPGATVTAFHDSSLKQKVPYSIVTLQMAGYVAKDKYGNVSEDETAPSPRWAQVVFAKGKPFSTSPYLKDNYVFMDEFVNFLVQKYGNASTPTGVRGYSLDNEPGLWPSTHPRIHPKKTEAAELISKSAKLSTAVKAVDPYAEIIGPALFGFSAYTDLAGAPDWNSVKGSYGWFVDYYLDQMKKESERVGTRLLDVFDVHWYPEARGGGERICDSRDYSNDACNRARVQAPRTLWDGKYKEDSWIGQWGGAHLPLLPKLTKSIEKYYPGTKLSVTEYNYGATDHITGGIAEADVLGVFGKYGVYMACLWPLSGDLKYAAAGINLYRNYDGKRSTYGDMKVKAESSDATNSSAYASVDSKDQTKLHVILINKSFDGPATMNVKLAGGRKYTSAKVYAFDGSSPKIVEKAPVTSISDNSFAYTIPALTACHLVLE